MIYTRSYSPELEQSCLSSVLHPAALYRESGLLPPEIELDQLAHMATVRLRRLDLDHPLQIRAEKVTLSRRPSSRFARRVIDLPDSERVNPIQYPRG